MARPHPDLVTANAALRRGDLVGAERAARTVLERSARDPVAHAVLGHVAFARAQYDLAARHFESAASGDRKQPSYLVALARANMGQGRYDDALRRFDRAARMKPDDAEAVEGKADVLERRGKRARAESVLAPWIRKGTATPGMVLVYARVLAGSDRTGEAVDLLRRSIDSGLAPAFRRAMLMRLARILDGLGAYDEAFAACSEGNALGGATYDADAQRAEFDAVMAAFSAEALADLPRAAGDTSLPVFVFGMPRSGTTLIEQILHAHPEAHGAGELHHLAHVPKLMTGALGAPYPACVERLTPPALDALAQGFLRQLRTHHAAAARIVDKSLENFEHLGLAAVLCPGAATIHARRNALDVCLSCFMQDLSPQLHPHASSLADLGHFYREYVRLIAHWSTVLERPPLDVDYEQLVADQETVSRAIVAHTGLPWDDACLQFHTADRAVATLSYDQVSKPIYTTAVERWRRYEKHLGPLIDALGDAVVAG